MKIEITEFGNGYMIEQDGVLYDFVQSDQPMNATRKNDTAEAVGFVLKIWNGIADNK